LHFPGLANNIPSRMSEPLDIRHLRYFLAVAEAGSFSRAADRLGISQPSVSQQMRDLEAGLRVPLFQRRGKRILLTPRGLIFQEHARAVLHQLENFLQELNSEPGELRGGLEGLQRGGPPPLGRRGPPVGPHRPRQGAGPPGAEGGGPARLRERPVDPRRADAGARVLGDRARGPGEGALPRGRLRGDLRDHAGGRCRARHQPDRSLRLAGAEGPLVT